MKREFFFVAALLVSILLQAQQDSSRFLNEVVVTANKYPNKTSLTGKVISIITREQLDQSGAKDLSRVLTEQAGVYINGASSNPGKDKSVYLMGARVDHTLICVDGIPVYDASGIGSNFDIRLLPVDNVERIEILKGSQSTLYGSDAIAGVINIITRKKKTDKLHGNGMLSYGSYNTRQLHAGISGGYHRLDFNAGFTQQASNGINEVKDTFSIPHPTDRDGFSQESFQASLRYTSDRGFFLRSFLRITRYKADLDQGAYTDELDYASLLKNAQAGFTGEIPIGKKRLYYSYQFNNIKRTYVDDSVNSTNGFDRYSRGYYQAGEHFAELMLVSPVAHNWKITSGTDYRNSHTSQEFLSISSYGSFKSQLESDSLRQHQLGIYAALTYQDAKGKSLETGGRLNFHSAYGSNGVYNINPSWLITKRWKLFGNLSTGYRTPSLYQLFSEYGNRKLQPELSLSLESGFQYFSANGQWTHRALFFSRKVKDVIAFFYDPLTFQARYINQDRQYDHGLEWESVYAVQNGLTLKFNYTYVDGRLQTRSDGKDTTYFNLLRRPRHSAGLYAGIPLGKGFLISHSFRYVGSRSDAVFNPNTFSQEALTLPGFFLWDIYLEFKPGNSRARIFADFRNTTHARYEEVAGYNSPGFNLYGGFRADF